MVEARIADFLEVLVTHFGAERERGRPPGVQPVAQLAAGAGVGGVDQAAGSEERARLRRAGERSEARGVVWRRTG